MGESKMISKIMTLFLAIYLASSLTACSSTKGANIKYKEQRTIDDTHPRATLILGTTKLVDNILITNVKLGKVGLLNRAGVEVQNLTDHRYTLEYKFAWHDKQGFEIDSSNMWHRFILSPRKIKSFQSVGKTEDAYSIQFTVRFPDDHFIESDRLDEKAKPFFD